MCHRAFFESPGETPAILSASTEEAWEECGFNCFG